MRILLLTLLILTQRVEAHNNLFLPNDAYFSTFANDAVAEQLKTGKDLELTYFRFSKSFMKCGYAGIRNAKITNLPEATHENLKTTLAALLAKEPDKGKRKRTKDGEEAAFPVLVYNKDFDFTKFPLALKFNEHFAAEQIELAGRKHSIDDRVDSAKLRKLDTTRANDVRKLDQTSTPDDLKPFMGTNEPVVIDGSKIIFVVLLGSTEKDLRDHIEKQPGREYIVIGETVSRHKY